MINFSSSFGNFSNIKTTVRNGLNSTNSSSANKTNSTNSSANSNEVLGYKVDKEGYFTSEFNEKAGIPKDYKIHSSTMQ